jgi:hypothetical protein
LPARVSMTPVLASTRLMRLLPAGWRDSGK